jgi:hypothetical protein
MQSANIVILHDLLLKVIYEHFIEVLSVAVTVEWVTGGRNLSAAFMERQWLGGQNN